MQSPETIQVSGCGRRPPDMAVEADRLRELHKYFRPPVEGGTLPVPPEVGLSSHPYKVSHREANSEAPDTTLTAFLQLITLRFSAQRAIVSLVDKDDQYFIAEATQTGNLLDPAIYDSPGDEVWMGCQGSTHRSEALCTNTIKAEDVAGSYPSFVVTDLQNDSRFMNLPYVRGTPRFRYYAGTPLISKSGFRIGSLFVFDTRVLPPLNKNDIEFLGIMAANVMNYLEMRKETQDQRRYASMSRGLAAFVEGKVEIPYEWAHRSAFDNGASLVRARSREKDATKLNSIQRRDSVSISSTAMLEKGEVAITKDVFSRASNLLRQSLDVDYALFFDTSADLQNGIKSTMAEVVGIASKTKSASEAEPHYHELKMEGDFLKALRQRYPLGKIWSFHEDGSFAYEDEAPMDLERDEAPETYANDAASGLTESEHNMLIRYFPRARQILYCPLWDNGNPAYMSACFVVSEQEVPVFRTEVEAPFVRAFVNSVAVVCGHMTAILGEEQKASFISSMSHELRSPLHGILASTELLAETPLTLVQRDLCETVDVCGQTLLDTISQILDYSNVNKFLHDRRKSTNSNIQMSSSRVAQLFNETVGIHAGSSLNAYSECDVSALCEESLSVVALAFKQSLAKEALLRSRTELGQLPSLYNLDDQQRSVLVDFTSSKNDWNFLCSPGAIRRIVMNLVGNSLKYTREGFVAVELCLDSFIDKALIPTGSPEVDAIVVLKILDSSRGMSADFLSSKLFVPFSQESNAVQGSGLGLSLVKGIVKSLEGTIEVQSRVGRGTTIEVRIPLRRSRTKRLDSYNSNTLHGSAINFESWCEHKTYSVLGSDATLTNRIRKSLQFYLQKWWGIEEASSAESADIVFLGESHFEQFRALGTTSTRSFLLTIVLFTGAPVVDVRETYGAETGMCEPLIVPFGPGKLLTALQRCLDRSQTRRIRARAPSLNVNVRNSIPLENGTPDRRSDGISSQDTLRPSLKMNENRHYSDDSLRDLAPEVRPLPIRGATELLPQKLATSSKKSSLRVLCVDDNSINLKLLYTYVKKLGFEHVESAMDGLQASQAAENCTKGFDLIFMDLTMPVCDGFESTRRIRQLEKERKGQSGQANLNTPSIIIALTGLASENDQKNAFAAGVDHFLTKPLRFKDLKVMLSEWKILGETTNSEKGG